jgi:DNA-directed RNA polymerase specialized sigma24 family protein
MVRFGDTSSHDDQSSADSKSQPCPCSISFTTSRAGTILTNHSNCQRLQRAIENLPVQHREPLLLWEVEEMSYLEIAEMEIAEILSIPTGTVMSRPARTRKGVRQSLLAFPRLRGLDSRQQPFLRH